MAEEIKKKNLFWFLIVFVFIVLIISWQFFLKNFRQKREMEDNFIKDLVNQGDLIKESFDKLLYNLKEIKLINPLPGIETEGRLTNEALKKLKEKVLEHVNQELIDNYQLPKE